MGPNIPLRAFCYVEHVVESYLYDTGKNNEVYGNKLVKIPTPKIVVLYNVDESNDKSVVADHEMRLSDAFETPGGDIEVIVHAYNINTGNHLPNICTPLNDYSSFVGMYRKNARKAKTKEERIAAADAALTALPDGEVKSYILSQRSEVIDMLLTEYDEKKVMECLIFKKCYFDKRSGDCHSVFLCHNMRLSLFNAVYNYKLCMS